MSFCFLPHCLDHCFRRIVGAPTPASSRVMSDLVGRGVKAISKQRYNAEKSGVRDVRSGQTKSMQRCICVRIDVQLSSHDFLRDLAFDVVLDSVSVLTTAAQLAKLLLLEPVRGAPTVPNQRKRGRLDSGRDKVFEVSEKPLGTGCLP